MVVSAIVAVIPLPEIGTPMTGVGRQIINFNRILTLKYARVNGYIRVIWTRHT